jgi:hypothetical protein
MHGDNYKSLTVYSSEFVCVLNCFLIFSDIYVGISAHPSIMEDPAPQVMNYSVLNIYNCL